MHIPLCGLKADSMALTALDYLLYVHGRSVSSGLTEIWLTMMTFNLLQIRVGLLRVLVSVRFKLWHWIVQNVSCVVGLLEQLGQQFQEASTFCCPTKMMEVSIRHSVFPCWVGQASPTPFLNWPLVALELQVPHLSITNCRSENQFIVTPRSSNVNLFGGT